MKQKLKCQTHKKLHTKKLCKMILVTIIYSLLLCSCFAKSSSDNTTTKETITGLLKEQKETPSDSIKKKVKKLDDEGNEVYTILFDEITNIYKANKSLENYDTFHGIKRLCELYQENYPDNQNTKIISSILDTITSYGDNESKLRDIDTMYGNSIEEIYDNIEYREFYIIKKLDTVYEDTIVGAISKGVNSVKEKKDEFLATDVDHDWLLGDIPDSTSNYVIQPISSFSKDGVYNLYVIENGLETLVDYNGFPSEAPVYRQIDIDILNKNLDTYYTILQEQENLQKQLGRLLNDKDIQEETYNSAKNNVNHNQNNILEQSTENDNIAETEFENINLFLSNFSEVGLPYFSSENYDRSELIRFAVIHHILNTNKVQYVIDGVDGISASTITDTIKKYFDITIYPPTSEDSPEAVEYGIYYLEPNNIYYWDSSVKFDLCYFTSLDTVTVDNDGNYIIEASVYYASPGNINSSTYANPPSSTANVEYNYSILATLEPRNGSYILKNYEFI